MTPRRRRMLFVALIALGVGGATAFALRAFNENMLYYVTPSELLTTPTVDKSFRLGGMVKQGSVERSPGSLTVRFVVTDFQRDLPVSYTGVLPDLFREGQGVIARGKVNGGVLQAEEVLAKHDEKYMPPGVADKIKQEHGGSMPMAKP